jgi:galactose mutarotase-like enzyme
MGTIAVEQRQYTTYVLADPDSQSILEVVPERGGIVTRWQLRGQEIFYLDAERFTHPDLSVRGGIPILFPICGNLPDNTYTHNGTSYTLKQHGFARELPWTVTAQTTEPVLSLTVTLASNDQTRSGYPFDFQVTYTYVLEGTTLTLRQTYTNRSATSMPFSAGFHPYFWVGDKSKLQVDIPGQEYSDNLTKTVQPYNGRFDFDQAEIDAAFVGVPPVASVADTARGIKVTVESAPEFSTLVFWTQKGKDFYCLEPWTAPRNSLLTGDYLITLAPGSSLETITCFKVEFLQ